MHKNRNIEIIDLYICIFLEKLFFNDLNLCKKIYIKLITQYVIILL